MRLVATRALIGRSVRQLPGAHCLSVQAYGLWSQSDVCLAVAVFCALVLALAHVTYHVVARMCALIELGCDCRKSGPGGVAAEGQQRYQVSPGISVCHLASPRFFTNTYTSGLEEWHILSALVWIGWNGGMLLGQAGAYVAESLMLYS